MLPDYTGGRFVRNTNAPQEQVPAIFEESSSYYLLGFAPADRDTSRPLRSIDVKVHRPGVRVQARRQYLLPGATLAKEPVAPATGADPAAPAVATSSPMPSVLADALNGLLPVSRVPMSLHAAAFARPGAPGAVVALSTAVDAFAPDDDAAAIASLEIAAGAYDGTGRPATTARQTLDLSWPPAAAREQRHVEALSRLELPPGDYEIRVAAAGADGTRTASVFTHVTVPDYAGAPLSLSHIVFGADRATTSSAPPDFLDDVLPVAPTTAREFARSSAVTAFMQVYQGTGRNDALQPVGVRVRILNERDEVVRDQGLVLPPDSFEAHRAADVRFTLPVQNLPAGEHLLALEAQMGERQAGRAVRFRVK